METGHKNTGAAAIGIKTGTSAAKTKYRYNVFNQQTAVLMRDGQVQENRYDAEDLRAKVSENGRKSRFLYYNGELLAEPDSDETVSSR